MNPVQSQSSIRIQHTTRWALRVLHGRSAGQEFPLTYGILAIGAQQGCQLHIPASGVAPHHGELHVTRSGLTIVTSGPEIRLNGRTVNGSLSATGGDVLDVGVMQLQVVDHAESSPQAAAVRGWLEKLPAWAVVGVALSVLAFTLVSLTFATGNPRLIPITTLVSAAVVPFVFLSFVQSKYGSGVVSLRSLLITLGLGATLGVGATVLLGILLPLPGVPLMAPVLEEPAKLLATVWCWYRLGYRNPQAGFVLGLSAGIGFEVAETAGYFFEAAFSDGLERGLWVLVLRSILAPFSHGIWTAGLASAWFQVGWSFRGPWAPILLKAGLVAMLLHAAWNVGTLLTLGASIVASIVLFVRLCRSRGTWSARWWPIP